MSRTAASPEEQSLRLDGTVISPSSTRPTRRRLRIQLGVRGELPLWLALIVAAVAGPVLDAGFPDLGLWPLTFVGIGLVLIAVRGQNVPRSLLIGFVAGVSFYGIHVQWATLFLGVVPWAALSVLEALFFALGTMAIALAYRWLPRSRRGTLERLLFLPVVVAGLWTAREAWASVWPYGGFSWGRVAQSQSESPLAPLFAWLGTSGVSFVMVLFVAMVIEAATLRTARPTVRLIPAAVVLVAMVATPVFPVAVHDSLRVGAVQGNSKAGYFDVRDLGDNLRDHVEATEPILDEDLDVIVWPEAASDINPLVSTSASDVFDRIADEAGVPLVGGAITERDGELFNTSMLWQPGVGPTDHYDKKHPVPFGEYVPDREFWSALAPDLIGMIARDYTPGTTDMVFDLGPAIAGINICFDIVDDQIMRESVEQGAQIIFAQTNNADFGRTDESVQQLAFARIRALELGRSVVNISTVGTSAIIAPDGSTIDELEWFTRDAMVAEVPLSDTETPALVIGRQLEWLAAAAGVLGLGFAGLWQARARLERKDADSKKGQPAG
ncbi:apolipoprotein N-acyltransferase [Diaminobutyricimonas sp. LJ205]|uniref:apolipoprotein N-acyltransferase n=1 Tax=Diaminobutyricimonas sp. LJ205 TaxID=2683590 RepID=UPI001E3E13E3|nr:apolipoprotein N-acyltransferase [Diaminobutyricimonas sp. LJ205]